MQLPFHLTPATDDCAHGGCSCTEPVRLNRETGRWFITLGHAGFNSAANNGSGYASREVALRWFRKFDGLRREHGAHLGIV